MIVSNLSNTQRIEKLHPRFKELFDYIKEHNLLNTECGKIEIDGEKIFINNVNSTCIKEEDQLLELHHKYIDIHLVLEGHERIGWKAVEELHKEKQSYHDADDCALYSDRPTTYIDLCPEEFAIFFPEDAHAPLIGEGKIRKIIAKVLI